MTLLFTEEKEKPRCLCSQLLFSSWYPICQNVSKQFNSAVLNYNSWNGTGFQKKILCVVYENWNFNLAQKFKIF